MSEDIRKDLVSPVRAELPAGGPGYPQIDDVEESPFPSKVKAAGVIWIVFGSLVLLGMALVFLLSAYVLSTGETRGGVAFEALAYACVSIPIALFGAAYLRVGIRVVRGTAAGTLLSGVGSMVFGLVLFAAVAMTGLGGLSWDARAEVLGSALGSVLLLTAGYLALTGEGQYKLWQKAQKARGEGDREAGNPFRK